MYKLDTDEDTDKQKWNESLFPNMKKKENHPRNDLKIEKWYKIVANEWHHVLNRNKSM